MTIPLHNVTGWAQFSPGFLTHLSYPSAIAAGDVLVMAVAHFDTGDDQGYDAPSGFRDMRAGFHFTYPAGLQTFVRVADGTESGEIQAHFSGDPDGPLQAVAYCLHFDGGGPYEPEFIVADHFRSGTGQHFVTTPSEDAPYAGAMVLRFALHESDNGDEVGTFTAPSGSVYLSQGGVPAGPAAMAFACWFDEHWATGTPSGAVSIDVDEGSGLMGRTVLLWAPYTHDEGWLPDTEPPVGLGGACFVRWTDLQGQERICYYPTYDDATTLIFLIRNSYSNADLFEYSQGTPVVVSDEGAPVVADYISVRDRAVLLFEDISGGDRAAIEIPGPLSSLFRSDGYTVDGGELTDLIHTCTIGPGLLMTPGGTRATAYTGGYRKQV